MHANDNVEIELKLSPMSVEGLMSELFRDFHPIYSKTWENDGFKIEFLFSYIWNSTVSGRQSFAHMVAIVDRGPNDEDCTLRFYGPQWKADEVTKRIERRIYPDNWGTCYYCGASYFYYSERILDGRVVECQNCSKKFKLDAD